MYNLYFKSTIKSKDILIFLIKSNKICIHILLFYKIQIKLIAY